MSDDDIIFIPATEENKDALAREAGLLTRDEAHARNVCVNCQKDVDEEGRIYSPAGAREYRISGMCELCFDELFGE